MTIFKASRLPLKSGISTSMEQPGCSARMRWITMAKIGAPPSLRSSRLTLVMTACFKFIALTAWATRSGSRKSRGDGCPRLMSQNPQERVQTSPNIKKVAVPEPQHSPMLGHMASSQTVCRDLLRISPWSHSYVSPVGARTRIHSGRRLGVVVTSPGFTRSRVVSKGIFDPFHQ